MVSARIKIKSNRSASKIKADIVNADIGDVIMHVGHTFNRGKINTVLDQTAFKPGTGDVLSGVIGAMLAQGLEPWFAAQAGVLAHALAGDTAAAQTGERGMLASDIIKYLPSVLNFD